MKKTIYVLMAMLALFTMSAFVSCSSDGGGGGGGGEENVTITFDLNYTGSTPISVSIAKNVALGAKLPGTPVRETKDPTDNTTVIEKWPFEGWNAKADGTGSSIGATSKFTANTTVYAQWGASYNPSTTVIVTFYLNDGTTEIHAGPFYVKKGDVFATPPVDTDDPNEWPDYPERDNFEILGWSTDKNATEITTANGFTASTVVNVDTDVYAIWKAIVPVEVTFDLNYFGKPPATKVTVAKGQAISDMLGVSFPEDPKAFGFTFVEWNTAEGGDGEIFDADFVVDADITVYAQWEAIPPVYTVPDYTPLAKDQIVEEIGLANGWFAVYQFVLPAGKTWGDYKELTAEYKVKDVTASARARMMGNITPAEVDIAAFGMYNNNNVAVVGQWAGGSSGKYIMDNAWGSDTPINTKVTPAPTNDSWFTYKYNITGTGAHGQWNGHTAAPSGAYQGSAAAMPGREPAELDEGPFYLAVGLSSGGSFTAQVKNVTLVGYDNTIADIIGMPLYFKNTDGTLFRAYNGQLEDPIATGDNAGLCDNFQGGKPSWKIIQGADKIVPIPMVATTEVPTPTVVTITFKANYDGTDLDITSEPADTTFTVYKGYKLPGDALNGWKRQIKDGSGAITTEYLFLGWYTEALAGVKVQQSTARNADATIFAHWVLDDGVDPEPLVITDATELAALVEAQGGGKVDDGYVIMASNTWNNADHTNNNDSLLTFAFPSDLNPKFNTIKITYVFKEVEAPTLTPEQTAAGWVIDAAGIWKAGYGSWTSVAAGAYFSFKPEGETLIKDIGLFSNGVAIQINKGDDNNNKQKRDGYVYGIKITKIEYSQVKE